MKRCDGIDRRDFVRLGALSAFGLGLNEGFIAAKSKSQAKSCILIWLDGGPSHLETFDMKPDAPKEVRGPFQPIQTNVPGITMSEVLPRTAQRMNRLAILRSVTSPLGEHNFGTHYMMTGYKPTPVLEYPTFGAVLAHQRKTKRVLPAHVAVPTFRVGGGRLSGRGFLPATVSPFALGSDPSRPGFQVRDLDFYPGTDGDRLARRKRYRNVLEGFANKQNAKPDAGFDQAYRLISSEKAKQAFDLSRETVKTKRRYGSRTIGQSCLLARRLVERGVPFVTVNNPGWDTHTNAYTRLKEGYTGARVPIGLIPCLDMALSALIDDLQNRQLLDQTLVVVMGEFGRTPKLNTRGGRDHWPRVFSVAMAGGGVRGGQVIGSSDAVGEGPKDQPITPSDLACTIYTLLGVNPRQHLSTPDGRPVAVSEGKLIKAVM